MMSLKIPRRRSSSLVDLPEALRHICGLEPSLSARDVGIALLEAIQHDELQVTGVPPFELDLWKNNPVLDWETGRFTVSGAEIPYTLKKFYTPMVGLDESIAVFEEEPEVENVSGPVAEAELQRVLSDIMSTSLKEADARQQVTRHFSPKRITDMQWRAAWKLAPNKRSPGQRDPNSSSKSEK